MTDFRALCAELVEYVERLPLEGALPLAERARAALAAEPQDDLPPKVGHILRLAEIIREVDGNHDLGAAALAEKILAHRNSRWQPAAEPQGPTDQEIIEFWCNNCAGDGDAGIIRLARWGNISPHPIPVSERLPSTENAQEIAWALLHVLDGVKRHDLEVMTGLSEPECDRIWDAKQLAQALPLPEVEG